MPRIIVTIGPSSINKDVLQGLQEAGADSFRINLSHSNRDSLKHYIDVFESCGILPSIDTQGAQLRIDELHLGENSLSEDDSVDVCFGSGCQNQTTNKFIRLNHPEASSQCKAGDSLRVDFGGFCLQLTEQIDDCVWKSSISAHGPVTVNRAVDIIGKPVRLSILTDFDKEAISYAIGRGCKEVYASFASSKYDVLKVREHIGDKDVQIIAKIESAKGLANAKDIIIASDEVLIDRGDLSREIGIPSVPIAVSAVSQISKSHGKPLNVATNVLDSMMNSPIPSRAEISDIFNLFDKDISGFVLAAEVAIGKNPVASTALLRYILDLYSSHQYGLHGVASHSKPSKNLIGSELLNWI